MTGVYIFGNKGKQFAQDAQGRQEVVVAGSNVEKIYFFDGLVIDSHGERVTPYINVEKYKRIMFVAISTLNSGVEVDIRVDSIFMTRFWNDDTSRWESHRWQIPPSQSPNPFLLNQRAPILNELSTTSIRWVVRPIPDEDPPTTGAFSLIGYGVK